MKFTLEEQNRMANILAELYPLSVSIGNNGVQTPFYNFLNVPSKNGN